MLREITNTVYNAFKLAYLTILLKMAVKVYFSTLAFSLWDAFAVCVTIEVIGFGWKLARKRRGQC